MERDELLWAISDIIKEENRLKIQMSELKSIRDDLEFELKKKEDEKNIRD